MLDIIIPTHVQNLELVPECVEHLDEFTIDSPFRVILGVDGGRPQDYMPIFHWMQQRARPWESVRWTGFVYYACTVLNCLPSVKESQFVAIMPPWIRVTARDWYGRIQQPFTVDPHAMIVAADLDLPPNMNPPMRLLPSVHPGCELFLSRRIVLAEIAQLLGLTREAETGELDAVAFAREFSRAADQRGGTRWVAPAVRAVRTEHHDHVCPQQENSETEQPQSESPSPTIPTSSTPITIEKGGLGALAP